MKPYKSIFLKEKYNKKTKEALRDQIIMYLKKEENYNVAIDTFVSGMYDAFSEFYGKDENDQTDGVDILKRIIRKLAYLIRTYPEYDKKLQDEESDDFNLVEDDILPDEEESKQQTQNVDTSEPKVIDDAPILDYEKKKEDERNLHPEIDPYS